MTSCSTCRFAVENPRVEKDVRGLRAIDLTEPKTYSCRRYPPTFVITPQGSLPMWPNMLQVHWCGEWCATELFPPVEIGKDRRPGAVNFSDEAMR